jgi:hypothetical protein
MLLLLALKDFSGVNDTVDPAVASIDEEHPIDGTCKIYFASCHGGQSTIINTEHGLL